MTYCANCGAKVETRFCPECGSATSPQLAVTTEGEVTTVVAPADPAPVDVQLEGDGRPAVRDRYREPSAAVPGDTIGETERDAHTETVGQVFNRSREQIAYRLTPSPKRLTAMAIKLVLAAIIGFAIVDWLGGAIVAIGLLSWVIAWLRNRTLQYRITSERLEVEAGVISTSTHMIELIDVTDAHIHRGPLAKLFGYSELTLTLDPKKYKGDQHGPAKQHLHALPSDRVKEIRDFIREAGMQDAARMDRVKIR